MTISRTASAIDVEITLALPEQAQILANMLELYVHDFSEIIDLRLGADGRFGYNRLPLYWKESNRYPFLITADGQLAGFALVRRGSELANDPDVWDMTEFFIVRGLRRRGLGMKAAQAIWKKFPGRWEVRVIDRNKKALEFWARATDYCIGKAVETLAFDAGGEGWRVFSFDSSRAE